MAGIASQWRIDLIDLQQLRKEKQNRKKNKGNICIDGFQNWALPIKDKIGKATVAALKNVILTSGRKLKDIIMDKGSEFLNKISEKSVCSCLHKTKRGSKGSSH